MIKKSLGIKILFYLLICCSVNLFSCSSDDTNVNPDDTEENTGDDEDNSVTQQNSVEQAAFDIINEYREQKGLDPLIYS